MSFEELEALYIFEYNQARACEEMTSSEGTKILCRTVQAEWIAKLDALYKEYFDGITSSNS